ncbi:MAG: hypothetical protein PWQ55_1188 [Chloroflexota bacterium]|nr:hypothetical protein [Chloroflexota bacterium]
MERHTSLRIAAIALCVLGTVEIFGMFMLLAPTDALPVDFQGQNLFWSILSVLYGLIRWVAGVAIWRNQRWGWALGLLIAVVTMIVAPSINPFGIMDLLFSAITIIFLLIAYYGKEQIA